MSVVVLTRVRMLRSRAGLLAGAPDGQDALLLVDGLPKGFGYLVVLQLGKDLRTNTLTPFKPVVLSHRG